MLGRNVYRGVCCSSSMTSRAKSTVHVEYELLEYIGRRINLQDLMAQMIPEGDTVAEKRFTKGAQNITKYLQNMVERRLHRLPKDHPAYRGKDE